MCAGCFSVCYLDTREGDSRGSIGANHQGDEGGTEVPKHVRELERKKKREEISQNIK